MGLFEFIPRSAIKRFLSTYLIGSLFYVQALATRTNRACTAVFSPMYLPKLKFYHLHQSGNVTLFLQTTPNPSQPNMRVSLILFISIFIYCKSVTTHTGQGFFTRPYSQTKKNRILDLLAYGRIECGCGSCDGCPSILNC